MRRIVVGISDCRVSSDPDVSLVTYALGSCIAVLLYEPVLKIGGMLHYTLPASSLWQGRAASPYMFADTGIPLLLDQARALGADPKKLVLSLAGGAHMLDLQCASEIGKLNYLAAKKVLWKRGLFLSAQAVGGELSRTVRLDVSTGKSWLREGAKAEIEFAAHRISNFANEVQRIAATGPAPAVSISTGGDIWHSGF